MAWDLLIRDGEVVTPDEVRRLDLAIEDGRIVELGAGIRGAARETIPWWAAQGATNFTVTPAKIFSFGMRAMEEAI